MRKDLSSFLHLNLGKTVTVVAAADFLRNLGSHVENAVSICHREKLVQSTILPDTMMLIDLLRRTLWLLNHSTTSTTKSRQQYESFFLDLILIFYSF